MAKEALISILGSKIQEEALQIALKLDVIGFIKWNRWLEKLKPDIILSSLVCLEKMEKLMLKR